MWHMGRIYMPYAIYHLLFYAARGEKLAKDGCTIFPEHALRDFDSVVELGMAEDVQGGAGRARFGVLRAENHPLDARVDQVAGSHPARRRCSIEGPAPQPAL